MDGDSEIWDLMHIKTPLKLEVNPDLWKKMAENLLEQREALKEIRGASLKKIKALEDRLKELESRIKLYEEKYSSNEKIKKNSS